MLIENLKYILIFKMKAKKILSKIKQLLELVKNKILKKDYLKI
jgi:hypothetical protein